MSGGIYAVMLRYAIWNNAVGVVCMLLFGKMRYLYNKREPRSIFPRAIAAIGGHAEIVATLRQESTERVNAPNSWDIHNPLDAGGYYERHIMKEFDNTSMQCS
ncbi:uncharacterized protein BO95DRAFT_469375 [Aspergillus brunneoviolaceus CBS 621.78]|uniref:Uncharacterized protein n=1 Tax=Aspergillus brunneoviolaceus CBS 621.78 TaxID=1450534 RepID=A0ACD1FS55_9EURO|nr:hypothetical protein BO95DRAFT_469375 [Aspergillus brunneoviolaceus CBS 621.78]RAH39816.1 hypothetical protein BO95DRAFT_469375 [Aspergillus brunneoviolaceus CBS 621.78]